VPQCCRESFTTDIGEQRDNTSPWVNAILFIYFGQTLSVLIMDKEKVSALPLVKNVIFNFLPVLNSLLRKLISTRIGKTTIIYTPESIQTFF